MLDGNTLTDSLSHLLGSIYFVKLEVLSLADSGLSMNDIIQLGRKLSPLVASIGSPANILFNNSPNLPQLKCLLLSRNKLTNCVGHLFHVRPLYTTKLERLWMQQTELNESDLKSLAMAVSNNMMPNLTSLDLSQNNLCTMQQEVESLVQACAQKATIPLHIHLTDNNLSHEFIRRIKSICDGSRVVLSLDTPALENTSIFSLVDGEFPEFFPWAW